MLALEVFPVSAKDAQRRSGSMPVFAHAGSRMRVRLAWCGISQSIFTPSPCTRWISSTRMRVAPMATGGPAMNQRADFGTSIAGCAACMPVPRTMAMVSASIIELARTERERGDAARVARQQHPGRRVAEQCAGAKGQRIVGDAARRELERKARDPTVAQRLHHAAGNRQRVHEAGARIAADVEHEWRAELGVLPASSRDELLRQPRESVSARRRHDDRVQFRPRLTGHQAFEQRGADRGRRFLRREEPARPQARLLLDQFCAFGDAGDDFGRGLVIDLDAFQQSPPDLPVGDHLCGQGPARCNDRHRTQRRSPLVAPRPGATAK